MLDYLFLYHLLISFLIFCVILLGVSNEYYSTRYGVCSMATLPWAHKSLMRVIQKHCDNSKPISIAELGCGWGGLISVLARVSDNTVVSGYEIAPLPYIGSLLRAKFYKNVFIFRRDFFKENLSHANVCVFYLTPSLMQQTYKKICESCASGSLILSLNFKIEDAPLIEHLQIGKVIPVHIYVYKVP